MPYVHVDRWWLHQAASVVQKHWNRWINTLKTQTLKDQFSLYNLLVALGLLSDATARDSLLSDLTCGQMITPLAKSLDEHLSEWCPGGWFHIWTSSFSLFVLNWAFSIQETTANSFGQFGTGQKAAWYSLCGCGCFFCFFPLRLEDNRLCYWHTSGQLKPGFAD